MVAVQLAHRMDKGRKKIKYGRSETRIAEIFEGVCKGVEDEFNAISEVDGEPSLPVRTAAQTSCVWLQACVDT